MTEQSQHWQSSAAYAYLEALRPSQLAWEFLRRNPDYQNDFRLSMSRAKSALLSPRIARWGLQLPADPELRADQTDAIWQATLDSSTLLLCPLPSNLSGTQNHGLSFESFSSSREGLYGVVVRHQRRFNALLLGDRHGKCLAALLPLDKNLPHRARTVLLCWQGHDPGHRNTTLSPLQRRRLRDMLRALDGHASGAQTRVIAQQLFGALMLPAREWKSHADRNRTRRLLSDGVKLVHGGYRRLLTLG